jgi:hypothetical protein
VAKEANAARLCATLHVTHVQSSFRKKCSCRADGAQLHGNGKEVVQREFIGIAGLRKDGGDDRAMSPHHHEGNGCKDQCRWGWCCRWLARTLPLQQLRPWKRWKGAVLLRPHPHLTVSDGGLSILQPRPVIAVTTSIEQGQHTDSRRLPVVRESALRSAMREVVERGQHGLREQGGWGERSHDEVAWR